MLKIKVTIMSEDMGLTAYCISDKGEEYAAFDAEGGSYVCQRINNQWESLGDIFNEDVVSLIWFKGTLIAAGEFISVGFKTVRYIAKWNGSTWEPLGNSPNAAVCALAVFKDNLIAGGDFTRVGNVKTGHIAKWNGKTWSSIGKWRGCTVFAITVYKDKLVAGGMAHLFKESDILSILEGNKWVPLITLPNKKNEDENVLEGEFVSSLAVYNGELIVGGEFCRIGKIKTKNIAKWDGQKWEAIGEGMNNRVQDVAVFKNNLIACGFFTTAGGIRANSIAKWNGRKWESMGEGLVDGVTNLYVSKNLLIANGWFNKIRGVRTNGIAKWNGRIWSEF